MKPIVVMIAVIAFLIGLFGLLRIEANIQMKNSPPASCQIFGGTWTIWNGWQC